MTNDFTGSADAPMFTDEELAELKEAFRLHHELAYGMSPEEFNALDWDVRIAMMQKAGVEFSAYVGGKKIDGKRRDPLTDPPISEH